MIIVVFGAQRKHFSRYRVLEDSKPKTVCSKVSRVSRSSKEKKETWPNTSFTLATRVGSLGSARIGALVLHCSHYSELARAIDFSFWFVIALPVT